MFFESADSFQQGRFYDFLEGGQNFEKIGQKRRFRHFLEILTKKSHFFSARSPSKLVYIGAKGAFRKFLGSISKIAYFKIVQRGTLWVATGGQIPERGRRPP